MPSPRTPNTDPPTNSFLAIIASENAPLAIGTRVRLTPDGSHGFSLITAGVRVLSFDEHHFVRSDDDEAPVGSSIRTRLRARLRAAGVLDDATA